MGHCTHGDRCKLVHGLARKQEHLAEVPEGAAQPPVRCITLSAEASLVFFAGANTIYVLNDALAGVTKFPAPGEPGEVCAMHCTGLFLIVGFKSTVPEQTKVPVGCIVAYFLGDLASPEAVATLAPTPFWMGDAQRFAHRIDVTSIASVAVEGAAPIVVSASHDALIKTWSYNAEAGVYAPLATLEGHVLGVSGLAMVAGALYSSSYDQTLRVWDLEKGLCLGVVLDGHDAEIMDVHAFDHDGKPWLVTVGRDDSVRIWDLADPARPMPMTGLSCPPKRPDLAHGINRVRVAHFPTGGAPMLLLGLGDGSLSALSLEAGLPHKATLHHRRNYLGHSKSLGSIAVVGTPAAPNGLFMTGGADGRFYAYEWLLTPP